MQLRRATREFLRTILIPVVPFVVFACSSVLDPPLPAGTIRFTLPTVYSAWWSLTAECSGRSGSVSDVEWFVVPGVSEFPHEGRSVSGYWSRVSNRVVLAEKALMDGALVRHEMLHALERNVHHSREAFLRRCGGVVVCITNCLREAGTAPAPRPGLARVPPDAMEIDVRVNPVQPGLTTGDSHFRLTVAVRNRRADSVVVMLPDSRDAAPPSSFSFHVTGEKMGLWYAERAWDPGIMTFGPGETRVAVFDFTAAAKFDGLRALPPGTYGVRGGFGSASSPVRAFEVGQ